MRGLGVWRCPSFASSWWFFLPGVSPVSLQEFTLGSTLSPSSFPPSSHHLGIFLLYVFFGAFGLLPLERLCSVYLPNLHWVIEIFLEFGFFELPVYSGY
jgi:hypothetical protein